MDLTAFASNAPGILVPAIKEQKAYVPHPLAPVMDKGQLLDALVDATNAIGELRGAARRLINPDILIRPLQRQEALTSSAMEGTHTTSDKLLLAELGGREAVDDSTREVRNYLAALATAQEMLTTLPLSHRVIKAAHRTLLSGTRGASKRPGEYRDEQNFIGSKTLRIEDARFVPPPPAEMQACMDELEKYLNREQRSDAERLIDMALVHYQLETIHPFADGNGRLGRMLITLMSMSGGLFEQPLLYVSPSIEGDKDRYIDLMFNVSAKGEWSNWIDWFLGKVAQSCKRSVETIDRLLTLQETMRQKVRPNIRSGNALQLVDMLFEAPAINVTYAASRLQISYAGAKGLLERLVELGIIEEIEDYFPRTFIAWKIVDVTEIP